MSESNEPRQVGAYELLEPVGSGDFGTVYRARDTRNDATVALKIISRQLDGAVAAQFRDETQRAALLQSPYIAHIIEVGSDASTPFVVTEYVDGLSLAGLIRRGPVGAQVALTIALQVAMALQAASTEGILHRDIKPQNILLAEDGTAKLTDFGMSSLVYDGGKPQSLDTAAYAAPEQIGGSPSIRSDIYSLGAVMFEMLSGRRPFEADSIDALTPMHLGRQPALEQLPPAFRTVVGRCLEKSVERRYQSPAELITALQTVRQQLSTAPATGTLATAAVPQATPRTPTTEARPAAAAVKEGDETPAATRRQPLSQKEMGSGGGSSKGRIIAAVVALGAIVAVAVVAILSLSGSEAAKPQFTTDPHAADRLAHNAMIPVSALPGSDWKITDIDPAESDKPGLDTDNCKEYNQNQTATKNFDKSNRIARAKEQISLSSTLGS